jgi:outer membrane protein assembly factor BamA
VWAALLLAVAIQDVRLKPDATVERALGDEVRSARLPLTGARDRQADGQEVLTEIRIQGNLATSDEEVQRMAGIEIGMPIEAGTVEQVAQRLRATKHFQKVEVLKRFGSITDPSKIIIVIIVDEGPVRIEMTGDPDHPTRVVQSHRPRVLFLPILYAEDGYGLTFGARLALPTVAGANSRLSFPLTLGGTRSAGIELDKNIDHGFINRLLVGGTVSRRENPAFEENDDRWQVAIRAEHYFNPAIRVGAIGAWQYVSFPGGVDPGSGEVAAGFHDSYPQIGAYVTVDSRSDPMLARNAVYVRAGWDRLGLSAVTTNRTGIDARAYIGLVGQPVLVLKVVRNDSDQPLPPFLKPLLGGATNLRGFPTGTKVGDTLLAGTAEVLVPLTSPLHLAKAGISAFTDAGTAYDKGQRLSDQQILQGFGLGVWLAAAFVHLEVSVAHGVGGGTRAQLGGAVNF